MASSDPIRIGLLCSTTGVTAPLEMSQLRGALQAVEEINESGGIDGRELRTVHHDPRSDNRRFRALAERLIVDDGVNVIFGGYMSSSRKAILPVVEKHNRLLFYPQQYEGFEYSENILYGGASPNQNAVPLADYLVSHHGARVYMVGSRYVYPYECNRTMQELVRQHPDGAVLGERYLELNAPYHDFCRVVADIRARRPDFVFCTVIGQTVPHLYRAFADAGLDAATLPIGSLNTSETEIAMMGADIAAGHFTSSPYFQRVDTEANRRAVARFHARFGPHLCTDMNWEAAYSQVHLFARAFERAGSDEIGRLLPQLLGSEFDAPQGRVQVDPVNHHTGLYPRIGRADATGQFTIVRESLLRVPSDPYLVTRTLDGFQAGRADADLSH